MKKDLDIPQKHKERLYPVVFTLFSQNDFHQVNIQDASAQAVPRIVKRVEELVSVTELGDS